MESMLLEKCAEVFGATKRRRLRPLAVTLYVGLCIAAVLAARVGLWRALVPSLAVVLIAPVAAYRVVLAREQLWRAARSALDDPDGRAVQHADSWLMGPTGSALAKLAAAVGAVRRGEYIEASALVPLIDRELLRPEELRLHEAVRAMIELGMGDDRRAAKRAVIALPTGSEAFDVVLGRAAVADAWSSPRRLSVICAAWKKEGVDGDPQSVLARLYALARLRLKGDGVPLLNAAEARALADEARAIGDERLASELDVRMRAATYR